MSRENITKKSDINAYKFLIETWRQTHSNGKTSNDEFQMPDEFSGKLRTGSIPIKFIWPEWFEVSAIKRSELEYSFYAIAQPGSGQSPLKQGTDTLITYVCNYATKRENSFIRRDSNPSYSRNQLLKYNARTAEMLSHEAINSGLSKRYEEELQFTTKILQHAHQFFPTSSKNKGREGFHAVLIEVQQNWENLKIITDTEIERQTLKEKISQLACLIGNSAFSLIQLLAFMFNNFDIGSTLNINNFYKKHDSLKQYRESNIGKLISTLINQYYSDEVIKKFTNTFLSNPEMHAENLTQLSPKEKKRQAIPKYFLSKVHQTTRIAFIKLYGIALELIHLHNVLKQLSEVAGLTGDYSMTHNLRLCSALDNALTSWEQLAVQMANCINLLIKAKKSALEAAPADKSTWVKNFRLSSVHQLNISTYTQETKQLVSGIRTSAEQLKTMGIGEYQQKLDQTISLINQYTTHLSDLGMIDGVNVINDLHCQSAIPQKQESKTKNIIIENLNNLMHDFLTLIKAFIDIPVEFYQQPSSNNFNKYSAQENIFSMRYNHKKLRFIGVKDETKLVFIPTNKEKTDYPFQKIQLACLYDIYSDLHELIEYTKYLKSVEIVYKKFLSATKDNRCLSEIELIETLTKLELLNRTSAENKFFKKPFISFRDTQKIINKAFDSINTSIKVAKCANLLFKAFGISTEWESLIGINTETDTKKITIFKIVETLKSKINSEVELLVKLEQKALKTDALNVNAKYYLQNRLKKLIQISREPIRHEYELTELKSWNKLLSYANQLIKNGIYEKNADTYKGQGYRKGEALKQYLNDVKKAFIDPEKKENLLQLLAEDYKPKYLYLKNNKSKIKPVSMSITHKRRRNYHYLMPCLWQNSEATSTNQLLIQLKDEVYNLIINPPTNSPKQSR